MRFVPLVYGFLLFSASLAASEPPPAVITGGSASDSSKPVFIAASAMYSPEGKWAAIVPEDWRIQKQQMSAMRADVTARMKVASGFGTQGSSRGFLLSASLPCGGVTMGETSFELAAPRDSPEAAIDNALAIVVGTVKSITPGFFYGYPGSLLELTDLDKLKLAEQYGRVQETLFIRVPYAHFTSGGIEYCRSLGSSDYAPAVGDQLLVFAYEPPQGLDGTFIFSTASDVIAQPAGTSEVHIPRLLAYFAAPHMTISFLRARIREDLARGN